MKIAIFGKSFDDSSIEAIEKMITELSEKNTEIAIYNNFLPYLKKRLKIPDNITEYHSHKELQALNPDFLFSLGGDGTILSAVTLIRDSGIPVVGINTGRLGFLSNVAKDKISEAIDSLWNNNYRIDKRNLLALDSEDNLFGDLNFALNEFTVHKKDTSSMITIHVYANDEYLNSYWADGLIVATPTGSTAYSLSCGGPIISPNSNNIILTPIAPHNLNVRPIVLSDNVELKLVPEGRSKEYLISLDSRSETIAEKNAVILRKCNFYIHMVELENHSFYRTIRHKLFWGIDQRN